MVLGFLLVVWSLWGEIALPGVPYGLSRQSWLYWVVLFLLGAGGCLSALVTYGGLLALKQDSVMRGVSIPVSSGSACL